MLKTLSIRRRLILCFALQTLLSLGGLLFSHRISESQVHVLGKISRDLLEHSVHLEGALFKIQSLPAEQTLNMIQSASVMYSEPEILQKAVEKMFASRAELDESIESVDVAIRDGLVVESLQETKEAVQRFNEAMDKATALLLKGQKSEGVDVLMNRCVQLSAAASKLASACTGAQSNKLEETRLIDAQRIASERRTLFWLIVGSLVAGLGFILAI